MLAQGYSLDASNVEELISLLHRRVDQYIDLLAPNLQQLTRYEYATRRKYRHDSQVQPIIGNLLEVSSVVKYSLATSRMQEPEADLNESARHTRGESQCSFNSGEPGTSGDRVRAFVCC